MACLDCCGDFEEPEARRPEREKGKPVVNGEAMGTPLAVPEAQKIPEPPTQTLGERRPRREAAEPRPPPKPSEEDALRAFELSLEEVKAATAGFDQEMYLGEGSSGRVFQGQLDNGEHVAVKVLKSAQQSEAEFLGQVGSLSRLHHEHVVALKRFCVEGDTRMLVYELAPYGSLYDTLHAWKEVKGGKPGPILHWSQRIRIAMGAAKGLLYLHEQALTAFPHKGVKSSNIMLFEDHVAKLGDFNLANESADPAAPFDPEHEFSKQVIPEQIQAQKADIYGLGVVLLELLTGRKPVDTSAPHNQQSLVTWAMPRLAADKVKAIVDPRLKGRYPPEGPLRVSQPGDSAYSAAASPTWSHPSPLSIWRGAASTGPCQLARMEGKDAVQSPHRRYGLLWGPVRKHLTSTFSAHKVVVRWLCCRFQRSMGRWVVLGGCLPSLLVCSLLRGGGPHDPKCRSWKEQELAVWAPLTLASRAHKHPRLTVLLLALGGSESATCPAGHRGRPVHGRRGLPPLHVHRHPGAAAPHHHDPPTPHLQQERPAGVLTLNGRPPLIGRPRMVAGVGQGMQQQRGRGVPSMGMGACCCGGQLWRCWDGRRRG